MTYSQSNRLENGFRFGDGYGRQRLEQFGGNFHRRMMTPGGWKEAAGEMIDGVNDYTSRFGSPYLDDKFVENLQKGIQIRGPQEARTIVRNNGDTINRVAREAVNVPGSKYAGNAIADAATKFKPLARAINVIPGLNLLGDIFDVGEAVVGVARKDKVRQGEARQLAQQMAASGMSLDQALQTIEQGGGQLESLVGNQGLDDFGKTAAYAAFTGVPSLNPIAAVAGLITAGDLQWEKYRRNQIFRNEFMKAQGRQ